MKLPLCLQPRDTYERHWIAARELRRAGVRSVVDVGGEGLLRRFLPGVPCVSVNMTGPAEVLYDGAHLPFREGGFDAAVSLDTLEHIPPGKRAAFAAELLRVARTLVIVAAPYGSQTHRDLERSALTAYREHYGREHEYLQQHVEHGLPDEEEMRALFPQGRLRFGYCGNCLREYRRFVANLDRRRGKPQQSGLVSTAWRLLRNANLGRSYRLAASPQETTNRVYVFVDKQGA